MFVDAITLERLNQSKPNITQMTFDWNSSAKSGNGHCRSHATPLIGVSAPTENSNDNS